MAAGEFVLDSSFEELPNPYPVMPDNKPEILSPSTPPVFFNDHQFTMVSAIAALIVPTDDDLGAAEAGVAGYIDELVAGSESNQKRYVNGLKWINDVSLDQYGKDFLHLKVNEQIELLIAIDESEARIYSAASGFFDRINRSMAAFWSRFFGVGISSNFFSLIRRDVFFGYYSSPLSWKVVGYYGPPQPLGYPEHSTPPSPVNYIDTIRPVTNDTCRNCHFDVLEQHDNNDQDECMECHDPHSPIEEYIKNG